MKTKKSPRKKDDEIARFIQSHGPLAILEEMKMGAFSRIGKTDAAPALYSLLCETCERYQDILEDAC